MALTTSQQPRLQTVRGVYDFSGLQSESREAAALCEWDGKIYCPPGEGSHVLVIDGTYLCAPDYDLNGFVEHAVMRGKDAVAYVNVDASDAGVRPRLSLEKNPAGRTVSNPEVVSVTPYPDALSNGSGTVSVCGPVWFLSLIHI